MELRHLRRFAVVAEELHVDRVGSTDTIRGQLIIERWRKEYSTFKPHSSLGYRPPAPEASFKTYIVQNMPEMLSSLNGVRTEKSLT